MKKAISLILAFTAFNLKAQTPTTMSSGLYKYTHNNYNNSSPYRPVIIKDDSFLISKIAFADSANAGEIIQYGGKYGEFYNTNDSFPLSQLGLSRALAMTKRNGVGYYTMGVYDMSVVQSDPIDTTIMMMALIDDSANVISYIKLSKYNALINSQDYVALAVKESFFIGFDSTGLDGSSYYSPLSSTYFVQKWYVDSVNNSDTLKYFRTDRPLKLDSVPQATSGDSLLTLVNGVVSKVHLTNVFHPIYVTHGTTFVDSSFYAFGVATPNKVVDSIFLLNLNESFSNIAIQNSRQLKYISARYLTYVSGAYNINGNSALTKAYSPNLEYVISVAANQLPMVDSLDFNRLKYIGTDFVASANITMTYLGLDSLIAIGQNFNIQGDSMITSLNLGAVLDFGGTVVTTGCKSMTSLTLNPNLKCGGAHTFTLNGCAFTKPSVDAILAALDASGVTNGTVNLSGGTSATPSAGGLVSKGNLVGKGWTVTHN